MNRAPPWPNSNKTPVWRAQKLIERRRSIGADTVPISRGAGIQGWKNPRLNFNLTSFFLKYYFLVKSQVVSFSCWLKSKWKQVKNSIWKKTCQIENQLGFFHPWIPGPLIMEVDFAKHLFSQTETSAQSPVWIFKP